MEKKYKAQKEEMNSRICSLKSTMKKLKDAESYTIKTTLQKYEKFLQ